MLLLVESTSKIWPFLIFGLSGIETPGAYIIEYLLWWDRELWGHVVHHTKKTRLSVGEYFALCRKLHLIWNLKIMVDVSQVKWRKEEKEERENIPWLLLRIGNNTNRCLTANLRCSGTIANGMKAERWARGDKEWAYWGQCHEWPQKPG